MHSNPNQTTIGIYFLPFLSATNTHCNLVCNETYSRVEDIGSSAHNTDTLDVHQSRCSQEMLQIVNSLCTLLTIVPHHTSRSFSLPKVLNTFKTMGQKK